MALPDTYTFRWGEGQISGFLSAALGMLGVLTVLCFRFPNLLTFPDLHRQYDPELMRLALGVGLFMSMALALANFCIGRYRTLGYIGMGGTALAMVLGGVWSSPTSSFGLGVPIGLDWFILDLLASALLFIPLERAWVLRRDQPILRSQWRLDVQYFALVHLLVSLIIIISAGTVSRLFSWSLNSPVQAFFSGLPLWVQFPLIVLVADLAQYWSHRLMHTVPFLWRAHAIHHSSEAMDWLASSRLHIGEVIITRTCVLVPVFVLGFSRSRSCSMWSTSASMRSSCMPTCASPSAPCGMCSSRRRSITGTIPMTRRRPTPTSRCISPSLTAFSAPIIIRRSGRPPMASRPSACRTACSGNSSIPCSRSRACAVRPAPARRPDGETAQGSDRDSALAVGRREPLGENRHRSRTPDRYAVLNPLPGRR